MAKQTNKTQWEVMADPIHKGMHPFHDSRYIVLRGTTIDRCPGRPNDWGVRDGGIICTMSDVENLPRVARMIAAVPELLEACKSALALIDISTDYKGMSTSRELRAAIAKATQ